MLYRPLVVFGPEANAFATRSIIIPGRGGTAYRNNIPLWTPREALENPATIMLNQISRYTPDALRRVPNLARAMLSRVRPTFVRQLPLCNNPMISRGPAACPKPPGSGVTLTGSQHLVVTNSYVGSKYTASSSFPAIDGYGALANGVLSGPQLTASAYGQNPVGVNVKTLPALGVGTYQHGTTTFTVHPTLPMVRFTDPVHGSGVVYYNRTAQVFGMSLSAIPNVYFGVSDVQYPSAAPVPQSQWPSLGLMGVGIALGVAALAVAAAPLELTVATAAALSLGVLGLAAGLFGAIDFALINGLAPAGPTSPGPTPVPPISPTPFTLQNGDSNPAQIPYAPPDGLGTDGYNPTTGTYSDGGGGKRIRRNTIRLRLGKRTVNSS